MRYWTSGLTLGMTILTRLYSVTAGPIPPSETNFRHVTIFKAPSGRSAMYPSLVDLGNGTLLCAFRTSTLDDGNPWTNLDDEIVCILSRDGGDTWDPKTLTHVYHDDQMHDYINVAATPLLGDGRVLLTFYQVTPDHDEGDPSTWHARVRLTRSADGGRSWSEPTVLDTPIISPASFGGIIRLQNGDLLISHYGIGNPSKPNVTPGLSAPAVMRSSDEGETWRDFAYVAYEQDLEKGSGIRGINETDITQLGDGRLLAMSRTYKRNFPLYRSISTDNGRTWTFGPTELHGLCPAVQWVPEGPVGGTTVLAYHDRYLDHKSRGGIYVAFTHDAGETWGYQTWIAPGAYPCLLQLESGDIFLAYYKSAQELQGTFFRVPFPTGIRARVTEGGVQLVWDRIRGDHYTYCIHRGLTSGFEPSPANTIAQRCGSHFYRDTAVEAGRTYHYIVTAWDGKDKRVGKSWEVAVEVR